METKNWYAWINLMPPKPDDLHVIGEVLVGNPGVKTLLSEKEPQGFNPNMLLLDLHLVQQPGMWPEVMTWVQCRYDKVLGPGSIKYTEVSVIYNGGPIATMKVDEVV